MSAGLVTANEAARIYETTVKYVYKLAHKWQWDRLKWEGRTYYKRDQVDAVLGKDPDAR